MMTKFENFKQIFTKIHELYYEKSTENIYKIFLYLYLAGPKKGDRGGADPDWYTLHYSDSEQFSILWNNL